MSKDDSTFTNLADPIEIRIRVTPKIKTEEIVGGLRNSLHFVIESEGEEAPELHHWHQRYDYYGEREGPVWEEVKADWLAQYHYVLETIKYALMRKADLLCGEAAVAQYRDVEWEPFFEEVSEHLYKLYDEWGTRFPPERHEGTWSRQAWARIEALTIVTSNMIEEECRLLETPVAESEEAIRTLQTHAQEHARRRQKLKRFLCDADIAIKHIASSRKPGQRSGLPIERLADTMSVSKKTIYDFYGEFSGLEDEFFNRHTAIRDGDTTSTAEWVATVLNRFGMV
ncbi:MAG TPA: hypothetical protein VF131_21390 [Blastocatellia bacterium]|nr:hypothetical protein [Blastocatellia bacterium]